ncbi:unnamed protein product [Sphagnum troendelagicum]|uniref:Uncharacterized protein n=1 Tax=Sphagnum troendelagicum TaxID=128251 RepID=A0ABP0URL0_9BRYO
MLKKALKSQAYVLDHPPPSLLPLKCSHKVATEETKLKRNCTVWRLVAIFFQGGGRLMLQKVIGVHDHMHDGIGEKSDDLKRLHKLQP